MTTCPACGSDADPTASACGRCGLAAGLFEPVREALDGSPSSAGMDQIRELLALVGGGPPKDAPETTRGELARPLRFPSAPRVPPPVPRTAPPAEPFPELPALPPGDPGLVARREVESLQGLARRLKVSAPELEPEGPAAESRADAAAFEALRRGWFLRIAAHLAEELEVAFARRAELVRLLESGTPDDALERARESLARGDLDATDRALRDAMSALDALEERWSTVQVLALQVDLVLEELGRLGGDPAPALGPLSEARRCAREGDHDGAEALFARSLIALWQLLAPRLAPALDRVRDRIRADRAAGRPVDTLRDDVQAFASAVTRRNFGRAVVAYRRLTSAPDVASVPGGS